jgi:hypothetical protein
MFWVGFASWNGARLRRSDWEVRIARTFLLGHLVGVAMVMAIVEGIWIAGGFHMVSQPN